MNSASRIALLRYALALYVFAATASAQLQLQKLQSNDPPGSDRFGESVSIDNKRAVFGAPLADGLVQDSGAAYLFEDSPSGWVQTKRFVTADGQAADLFGQSVAIYGGRAAIGAPRHSPNGARTGAVYVFTLTAVGWAQTAKLVPSDGQVGDGFGTAVSVFEKTIVVGAPSASGSSVPSFFAGAVYVFQLEANGWVQTAKLQASDVQPFREFGRSLSLFQTSVLIGSPSPGPSGVLPEAAYLFEKETQGWVEKAKLFPADPKPGNVFGNSVSLWGAVAMVGAPKRANTNGTRGSVYVYSKTGSTWSQVQRINPPNGPYALDFGDSVAVLNGRALVGAPFDNEKGTNAGAAYSYVGTPVGWLLAGKLLANDGNSSDFLGGAVGLAIEDAVVGAFAEDSAAPLGGAVYVFDANSTSLVAAPKSMSVATGGTQTYQLDAGAEFAGLTYLLLGTASGKSPGLFLNGNVLPINYDSYTELFLVAPNVPPLFNTLGTLDVLGRNTGSMFWPPNLPPGLVGKTLHHAFLAIDFIGPVPFTAHTSNAVSLRFIP